MVEVKDVKISVLKPASYNPRSISQSAFESLQRSLDEFGMPQPIIINKTSGVIVSGHMRLNAAKALGWETVPVIEVELDDKKEKAFNILLNNRSAQGEFDTDQLAELLHELDDESLILTGFDEAELEKLQDGWIEHGEDGPIAPDEPKKPYVAKYAISELRSFIGQYPYSEHRQILTSFVDWLENRSNTK